MKGDGASIGDLAGELGVSASYFSRIVRLSFIAPTLVQAILDGRQPKRLLAKRLTVGSFRLPTSWKEQAIRLGLASA